MDIDISEPNPSPNSCDCSGAAGPASASTGSQSQSSSSPCSSSSSSSDRPSDGPNVSSPRSSASSGFKRRFQQQSDRRPRSATLNAGCNQQYHQQTRSRNIRSIPLTARPAKSAANPDHASLESRRRPMLSTAGRYHSEHFQGVHRIHNDHASCEDDEEDDECTAPLESGREAKRQKRLDGPNADNTSSSSSNYTSSSTPHHAPSAAQGGPAPALPQRRKRAASLALEDEIQLFRKHQRNSSTSSSTSSSSSSSSRSSKGSSSPVVSSRSSIRAISNRLQSRRVFTHTWSKRIKTMDKKLSSSPLAAFVEQRKKRDFKHRPSLSVHASPTKALPSADASSLPSGTSVVLSQDDRGIKQVSGSDVQEMRAPMASTSTIGQAKPLPPLSHTQLSALHQLHLPRPTSVPAATLAVPSSFPSSLQPRTAQAYPSVLVGISSRSSSHSGHGGKVPAQPTPSPSIPSLKPPITQDTLKELDLNQVLQCKQLRHDIVFDANLMFRPNFDGNRGDRKRESSHRYWLAITRELETGCRCTAFSFPPSATAVQLGKQQSIPLPCICRSTTSSSNGQVGQSGNKQCLSERLPSRIVPLVAELRDILLALLPLSTSGASSESSLDDTIRESHKLIMDTLDPDLIAQQASHNLLNLSSLSSFFGRILKSHCAPMRDEVIECMMASISQGGEKKDMAAVSNGLKMSFEILELMKLDITNHQLRILRPVLVEGATEFEYKSFLEQYAGEGQQLKLELTKKWYNEARSKLSSQGGKPARILDILADGILEILFKPENLASSSISTIPPHRGASSASKATTGRRSRYTVLPTSSSVPETLQLDLFRLQLFHGDVTDLCVVYLLLLLFRQLCSSLHKRVPTSADIESVRKEIWTIMSEAIAARNIPPASGSGKNRNPIPTGIKKLDSVRWKDAMKDVILQVARKAAPSTSADAPSQSTLDMLTAWSENNLKADGKLFMLVQTRLRTALYSLLQEELNPPAGQSTQLGNNTVLSTAEAAIKKSGLADLSNEVRLLSSRIGKVVSHHHKTYQRLYSTL